MKNFFILLTLFLLTKLTFAQSLSIEETISYINTNISSGSKISLNKNGVLTYSTLLKDYTLRKSSSYDKKYHPDRVERLKTAKIVFNIHIGTLNKIEIFDPSHSHFYGTPNFVNEKDCNIYEINTDFGNNYRSCLNEWTVKLKCNKEEVYHLKKGDCISVNRDLIDKNSTNSYFEENFDIRTKDGFKKSAEKIRNALLYLIDSAKRKGLGNQEIDDDPFASNNFNTQNFDIEGEKDSSKVKLLSQNGVYYIIIKIGGISKKLILDSGASDVLISKKFEMELISKGIIKKENYLSNGLYKIADGSIISCRRLLIPELKIGSFTLKNVRATITSSNSMLLGKSVLDKFKSWKINNLTEELEIIK